MYIYIFSSSSYIHTGVLPSISIDGWPFHHLDRSAALAEVLSCFCFLVGGSRQYLGAFGQFKVPGRLRSCVTRSSLDNQKCLWTVRGHPSEERLCPTSVLGTRRKVNSDVSTFSSPANSQFPRPHEVGTTLSLQVSSNARRNDIASELDERRNTPLASPSTDVPFVSLIVQLHWQKFCPVCGGNGVGSTAVAAGTATLR